MKLMEQTFGAKEIKELVENLNIKEKIDRSLALIDEAYREYGDSLVVANSLGKDSMALWDLAMKISPKIKGFIITTRHKPKETIEFMEEIIKEYPTLKIFRSNENIPHDLYNTDPDKCCDILKVKPTQQAIVEMGAKCWVTGLRCTEGKTRTNFREVENRDEALVKLNPILLWKEREVWQYLAINQVKTNALYSQGYRSLGCSPCTHITNEEDERAGRWINTPKRGGECGIHTKPMLKKQSKTCT